MVARKGPVGVRLARRGLRVLLAPSPTAPGWPGPLSPLAVIVLRGKGSSWAWVCSRPPSRGPPLQGGASPPPVIPDCKGDRGPSGPPASVGRSCPVTYGAGSHDLYDALQCLGPFVRVYNEMALRRRGRRVLSGEDREAHPSPSCSPRGRAAFC